MGIPAFQLSLYDEKWMKVSVVYKNFSMIFLSMDQGDTDAMRSFLGVDVTASSKSDGRRFFGESCKVE